MFKRIYHFFAMRNPDGFGKAWIERHSMTEAELFSRLAGKSVALVGNARALLEAGQAAEIDAYDIVIRMNKAPGLGTPGGGYKIDWIATAGLTPHNVLPTVLWLGRRVRKVPYDLLMSGRLFVYSSLHRGALSETLTARASTGVMAVELLLRSPARSIDLFGFDFYESRSLSGEQTLETAPHAYGEERKWITARLAGDARLTLHPMVKSG